MTINSLHFMRQSWKRLCVFAATAAALAWAARLAWAAYAPPASSDTWPPLLDAVGWVALQAALAWRHRWSTLASMLLVGTGTAYGLRLCLRYCAKALRAAQAQRVTPGAEPPAPTHIAHYVLDDTASIAFAFAPPGDNGMQAPARSRAGGPVLRRFPRPTAEELWFLAGVLYGAMAIATATGCVMNRGTFAHDLLLNLGMPLSVPWLALSNGGEEARRAVGLYALILTMVVWARAFRRFLSSTFRLAAAFLLVSTAYALWRLVKAREPVGISPAPPPRSSPSKARGRGGVQSKTPGPAPASKARGVAAAGAGASTSTAPAAAPAAPASTAAAPQRNAWRLPLPFAPRAEQPAQPVAPTPTTAKTAPGGGPATKAASKGGKPSPACTSQASVQEPQSPITPEAAEPMRPSRRKGRGAAAGAKPTSSDPAGEAVARDATVALADLQPLTASLGAGGGDVSGATPATPTAAVAERFASPPPQPQQAAAGVTPGRCAPADTAATPRTPPAPAATTPPPPPPQRAMGAAGSGAGTFRWGPDVAALVAATAPRVPSPPHGTGTPSTHAAIPLHRLALPLPVPVPGPAATSIAHSAPTAPQQSSAPSVTAGLNPALASFLRLGSTPTTAPTSPPPSTPAADTLATAGPNRAVVDRETCGVPASSLCSACGSAPRQAAVLHSASEGRPAGACYCLCGGCSAAFVLGAPCPGCGEPGERVMKSQSQAHRAGSGRREAGPEVGRDRGGAPAEPSQRQRPGSAQRPAVAFSAPATPSDSALRASGEARPAAAPGGSAQRRRSAAAPSGSAQRRRSAAAPSGSAQRRRSAAAPSVSAQQRRPAAALSGNAQRQRPAATPSGNAQRPATAPSGSSELQRPGRA
ncbi:hypothetical protein HYH03_003024 [Edaphochlamys debaryana]|uniref:Uncharacterized protein n=1 Tax=Edaphochlamys debaryana TaxID=47281 RepID=A0A835YDG6_9CHLO|nr:hypothetical protein HYH03_003024 [Edaphochlamys debaryana]|eukprot:KAG2498831.1 hypothetical protein HYH03_003024 [Edaphochlamys debaryana]